MNIPNEILGKWEILKSNGDCKAIAEKAGVSYWSVSKAISNGKCTDEVFQAIADYYKEKQEMIKSYISDYE